MTSAFLRLAIFDVDGTLVDSQHNIVAAMTSAFVAHHLQPPRPELIRRIIGLSLVEAVASLLPGESPDLHLTVARSYKDAFFVQRQQPDHTEPLFPGTIENFDRLQQDGWLLAVATGKSRRGLNAMLERHGLASRFVSLQTADDNPGKPHPGMVLRCLEETGVDPAAAVMIGDTAYDIQMGRAAGVKTVGVGWGYHAPEELDAAGATALLESVSGLPDLIGQLIREPVCVL